MIDAADSSLAGFLRTEIAAGVSDSLGGQLADLHRFVDRRFDELSAEIHASVTLAEMSEAALAGQIGRVHEEVARMVSVPIAGARTSGIELEAVVEGTEVAANRILEAAEGILDWLGKGPGIDVTGEIVAKVQTIFEACSFQDLTSQRIRRAIGHLKHVDNMLNNIASADPLQSPCPDQSEPTGSGADLGQDMIDSIMDD